MIEEKTRILLVDDDQGICKSLSLILEDEGYKVDVANTGRDAIQLSRTNAYNLAILDIRLPDIEGTKLLKTMREMSPTMVKIMLTGYPQLQNAIDALNDGADLYLTKPVDYPKLIEAIKKKLEAQKETEATINEKLTVFLKTRTEKLLQESE